MNHVLVTLVTCAEHVAILVPRCLMAAHLMLADITYHLHGCHLGGLPFQQVLGETEEKGCTTVQLLCGVI